MSSKKVHHLVAPEGAPSYSLELLESRRLLSASIGGTVFHDLHGHFATVTQANPVFAGRQVFLDIKGSGDLVAGDPVAVTDAAGHYTFSGLAAGTYTVRLVSQSTDGAQIPVGIESPIAGKYTVKLGADQNVVGEDFLAVGYASNLTALANGKLLTVTTLGAPDSNQTIDLRRFNFDGTVDMHFGRNGVVHLLDIVADSSTVTILSLHRDGSVLVGGIYNRYESPAASTNGLSLSLVNASGRVVRAVNVLNSVLTEGVGTSDDRWTALTLTTDGKIVATGVSPLTQRVFFDRFNADLTRDRHFGAKGRVTLSGATTVPQTVASGPGAALTLTLPDFSTAILNADGSIIHHVPQDFLTGVAVAGGKIVTTNDWQFAVPKLTLTRHNPDGSADATFGVGGNVELATGLAGNERARVLQLIPHGDGSNLLLVERTISFGSSVEGVEHLVRLSPTGTILGDVIVGDQLSPNGVGSQGPAISAIAETRRGKILLSGSYFSSLPSVSAELFVSRYNANLTPDKTFGTVAATSDPNVPVLYGVRLATQSSTDAVGELSNGDIALTSAPVVVVSSRGKRLQ